MLIVSIAWIYVVGMMAITETSIVAGILTFVLYCVLPLSLVLYLQRSKMRKTRMEYVARLKARQALDPALNPSASTPDASEKNEPPVPQSETKQTP